jgi:hypothetical protein
MSEKDRQTSAVWSEDASSTTTTSTPVPDARAELMARGRSSGRLWVVIMIVAFGIVLITGNFFGR